MGKYIFTFSLILVAVLTRLLPHPPNVAPIAAIALFSGVYLDRKHAFIVPIAVMLISDYFIGFHDTILWVYLGFLLIALAGLWLRKHQGITTTLGVTFTGSILFFILTNFGVWLSAQPMYPHNLAGLFQCYTAAIPFFRNSMIGDLIYVGAMFGTYELVKRHVPSLFAVRNKV